jgi:hypothetical protein
MRLLFAFVLAATLASAQQASKPAPPRAQSSQVQASDMNALWEQELPNMKSDLAELRSMLNVMASQESSLDLRSSGPFQTNRKMWQVVIARLAELTQRMDALERSRAAQESVPEDKRGKANEVHGR